MRGDQDAYSALGLRPGAPRSQIDDAYRRLIKIHHPDRNGGDGGRAAEINRAYTLLRRDFAQPHHRRAVMTVPPRHPRVTRRPLWLLILVVALGVAYFNYRDSRPAAFASARPIASVVEPSRPVALSSPGLSFDEPLHSRVIDAAMGTAMRFHSETDLVAAIEYSRDCHSRLRSEPSVVLFDACTAFDESTVTLAGSDPMMNAGPFGGAAVMARGMAAARAVSDDSLGAELRLNRIRSRVELTLIPQIDPAAGPVEP